MKLKRRRVGSGMTEREVVDLSCCFSQDDPLKLLEQLTSEPVPGGETENLLLLITQHLLNEMFAPLEIDSLEACAGELLLSYGLPSTYGFYREGDSGQWLEDTQACPNLRTFIASRGSEVPKPDRKFIPLDEIARRRFGSDSVPHHMGRMLQQVFFVRLHGDIGNIDGAVSASFALGRLFTEWTIKAEWEQFALSGKRSNESLAEARQKSRRKRGSKAQVWRAPAREAARETWQQRSDLSTSAVSTLVRRKLKESNVALPTTDRAISDAIRDLKPRKVGSD